jgi:hypothetical protein
MINTKLQSIIDTKSAIGNAIVNKGGTITGETPFFNYAAQIDGISTGSILTGNAAVTDVLAGQTFYSNDANTQLTGTYVAPTPSTIDGTQENISFITAISQLNGPFYGLSFNNGFLFAGGAGNNTFFKKLNATNLSNVGQAANYNGTINEIVTNNGFVYVGGEALSGVDRGVGKFHEGNLVRVGNTGNYGGEIRTIAINNGFIYVGGSTNNTVRKYNESTLSFVGNTASYGGTIQRIAINNGFIYVGGATNLTVKKFGESNLTLIGNTPSHGGIIRGLGVNNGFIFVSGDGTSFQKFHESNLVLNTSVTTFGDRFKIYDNFIYTSGNSLIKRHESNLALFYTYPQIVIGSNIVEIANNFVYQGAGTNARIHKSTTSIQFTNSLNGQAWYLIPKE